MNRRSFLAGIPALTLCGLVPHQIALADGGCRPVPGKPYVRSCVVGLRRHIAGTIYAHQSQSQWCWAACIAMVFSHYGYKVSQRRIVKESWGSVVNMPGSPSQIVSSLNRKWIDDRGRGFRAFGDVFSANLETAIYDLDKNKPLIIGTQGHAMVLTALEFLEDIYGNKKIQLARVRDPWPNRNRRALSASEWHNTQLLIRIRVS